MNQPNRIKKSLQWLGIEVHSLRVNSQHTIKRPYISSALNQLNWILWTDGVWSSTSEMSWSGVFDPELVIQHQHLTNAPVAECNQILKTMLHLVQSFPRSVEAITGATGDKLPVNTLDFRRNAGWAGVYKHLDRAMVRNPDWSGLHQSKGERMFIKLQLLR